MQQMDLDLLNSGCEMISVFHVLFLSCFACFDCIVALSSSNQLYQVNAQYFLSQLISQSEKY